MDTAGIRETEDIVERIGVERSRQVLKEADLILLVLNNAEKLSVEDERLFTAISDGYDCRREQNRSRTKNRFARVKELTDNATIVTTSSFGR